MGPPRVAYFPDSFHEVNGVAHTSRNFVAYAERRGLPFLCVRAGSRKVRVERQGPVTTLELPRSWLAVGVEKDLAFDPAFLRHAESIGDVLHGFRPDVIHMTGPSELGMFAAYFARKLGVPLAASWHTNVHEYARTRLPARLGARAAAASERVTWAATTWLYGRAQVLFAPNPDLCRQLSARTGRPCHLMQRGVDTVLFDPGRRTREPDGRMVLGFVGRLSVEKNVALLPKIERELARMGVESEFVIVGHGAEEAWLRERLRRARFAGVLRGEALAEAYADMDLLVFPSHTDTFGNVVLEALASGVPAIVTPDGGPRHIVRTGACGEAETGVVAGDEEFAGSIAVLVGDRGRLDGMRRNAREYALGCSWDAVFDRVYAGYGCV